MGYTCTHCNKTLIGKEIANDRRYEVKGTGTYRLCDDCTANAIIHGYERCKECGELFEKGDLTVVTYEADQSGTIETHLFCEDHIPMNYIWSSADDYGDDFEDD